MTPLVIPVRREQVEQWPLTLFWVVVVTKCRAKDPNTEALSHRGVGGVQVFSAMHRSTLWAAGGSTIIGSAVAGRKGTHSVGLRLEHDEFGVEAAEARRSYFRQFQGWQGSRPTCGRIMTVGLHDLGAEA